MNNVADFWMDKTPVLLKGFWGWNPDKWGMVSWTRKGDRENKIKELPAPFICVGYVTETTEDKSEQDKKGKICGFFLVSHEKGHRDEFTHQSYHGKFPGRFEYGLRASLAYTYQPEHRPTAKILFQEISSNGLNIAARGMDITNHHEIEKLRSLPKDPVPVY